MSRWIVVQLGSREQYNIARALHASGKLHTMITDLWAAPGTTLTKISSRAGSRYHQSLKDVAVVSFNLVMLIANGIDRFTTNGFRKRFGMIADRLFSYRALRYLKANDAKLKAAGVTHIFSYNYYCSGIFKWADNNGYSCVLGQIDAGPAAGKLVKKLALKYDIDPSLFHDHYEDYLPKWKIEAGVASTIVVNSAWSRQLLGEEGVDRNKIRIVPLAFEAGHQTLKPKRVEEFTLSSPLMVLFLGSMQIQKGVIEIFQAAEQLKSYPVRFNFAGSLKMPAVLMSKMPVQNCKWLGYNDRSQVMKLFGEHHVLLFPTHSDGFGLVQLEAQANGVPVIASTHCGTVIEGGVNGLVINEVSPNEIRNAVLRLLNNPGLLNSLAANARVGDEFSFNHLVSEFSTII